MRSDVTTNFAGNTAANINDDTATNSIIMNQQNMTCTDEQFNSVVMNQPPVFNETQPDEIDVGTVSMAKSGSEVTAPILPTEQVLGTPTLTGAKNSAINVPIYDPLMNDQIALDK